ncbi:MAG: hypothetical protein NZV14_13270 [Bryobacteraceae bacterium]|nr:hypothetical protein [Bryobacteraceae bacterium]MDW8379127.1 hypothetical protein [Bryobacterales bacterium]
MKDPSHARARRVVVATLWLVSVLSGCGYVGDPMPPALLIPMPPYQLTVQQQGGNLIVTYQYASMTTEGLSVAGWSEAELRIGPIPSGPFQPEVWAAQARRIPVSHLSVASPVRLEIPVTDFVDQEIACAARAAGPKGRWSGWSNFAALRIVKPLPRPEALLARSAPEGVILSWQVAESRAGMIFRIWRQQEGEEEFHLLADTLASPYVDKSAEYDKPYRYQVRAVLKQEGSEIEGDASEIVPIRPADVFPPSTPTGLNFILGVNSVELVWDRNTEPDFRGYVVYRALAGGEFVRLAGPLPSPAYSDKTVEAGRSYRYAVSALDVAGNESPPSVPVLVTTPP